MLSTRNSNSKKRPFKLVQKYDEPSAFAMYEQKTKSSTPKRHKRKKKSNVAKTVTDSLDVENANSNYENVEDVTVPDSNNLELNDLDQSESTLVVEGTNEVDFAESKDDYSDSSEGIEFFEQSLDSEDSKEGGKKMLEWMLSPKTIPDFMKNFWEKQPLHISRKNSAYYKMVLSLSEIDSTLRNSVLKYSENIDITSYENGRRETHNLSGRAFPRVVWDFYSNKCSIRILNPQTFFPRVYAVNTTLQEYFNCFVGANVYLTPPDSQGFAPHYDDIEAFILQIEGKKLWKIYSPRSESEVLPRVSSKNFDQSEIGPPIMEVLMEAGDVLYFPRGFIHQACTVEGEHSLHVTISTYQKNTWSDFFGKMFQQALEIATQNELEFRKGIPIDFFDNLGLVHSDSENPRRTDLTNQIGNLFKKITKYLPYDDAADQVYKDYLHSALPPVVPENERQLTIFGESDKMLPDGRIKHRVEFQPDTEVKLLRANILRLVAEDDSFRIYYSVENSKIYHECEQQYLEIDEAFAPAIEILINTYPLYVPIERLSGENDSDVLQLVSDLWDKGLIKCKDALPIL